jgi:hypothetical protein
MSMIIILIEIKFDIDINNDEYVIHAVFLTRTIELPENSSIAVILKEELRFAHQK